MSLFDSEQLAAQLEGHDVVANLATALPATNQFMFPWAWRENIRVRTEGSRSIVDAAIAAEVDTVIQESVAMLYPDHGDEWITEDAPADRYPMAEANFAAEANAQRFTATGRNGVVLRLGWFYGPGATHSEEFFALARRHVCIMLGRPDTYVSSIHVADAGRAVSAAVSAPAGIYNVVDDEPLTKRQYADAIESVAETNAWLRFPVRAALLLGNRTTSLTRSLRVSNSKFRTTTTVWEPRYPSAVEGWKATAAALLATPTTRS